MTKMRTLSAAAMAAILAAGLSCKSNHPPAVPAVPTGPDYCFKDTTDTFKTVATDPDGDSVAFRFDWGDSTASHWVGWFASGDTVAFTHAWSDTGNHEVRVSAQDRQLTSDLSEGLMVRVAIRWPPEAPAAPMGPDIGGQDSSYTFIADASHPDGIPVAIRFAWGDGDTSDWSEFVLSGEPVSASHRWSAPDAYPVTAQAKDTGELTSLWSPQHTIVVRPPDTLRGLRLVGPPQTLIDDSGFLIHIVNTQTDDVTISWLQVEHIITPDSAYMRQFLVDGNEGIGFPMSSGGKGVGDTTYFAPVTIAPNMSQEVDLMFGDFHVDTTAASPMANVVGKEFQLLFSDGSEIEFTVPNPPPPRVKSSQK
jgi:hypothetical protein